MRIRIATYNIHRCVGRDGVKNFARVAAVLREINADIVALQEVTSHHEPSDNMLDYLAEAADMHPIEGFTLTNAGTRYGNAILTRLPVSEVVRIDISVAGREPRGVIEIILKLHNCKIILWATHLGLGIRERQSQLKKILQIIDVPRDADISILLGDLNEWLAWTLPLRALRRYFPASQSLATFPSGRPLLKLDQIMVNPKERLDNLQVHSTELSRVASDHLPLISDIIV